MLRRLEFWLISIRVLYRLAVGRWYVLRDSPDWYVDELAELPVGIGGLDVDKLILAAREEQRLRLRQRARKLLYAVLADTKK